ncbi:MAG: hypothetical protein F4X11_15530 [Acidobacteria bacterium]|nr:hypothetical protein [Acidobacteriota bacterium]
MMTVDPAVLGGAFVGLVTLQLAWLGILVAVICSYYRRLDRRLQGIVERTYEPHRFTVGMPDKPLPAPPAAPAAPGAPPADPTAVGSR